MPVLQIHACYRNNSLFFDLQTTLLLSQGLFIPVSTKDHAGSYLIFLSEVNCPLPPMPRDFLKIKTKPLTNFCYFCFFTTWLGVEIKAQKYSQDRLECNLLGPPWSLCLMS